MEEPVHVHLQNSYKYTFFLIAFLFVSVFKDLEKWKDCISKLPDGLHIIAHDTELFRDIRTMLENP